MIEFEATPTGDGGYAVGPYVGPTDEGPVVPPEVPTQVAFPLRTLLRSIVQVLAGALLSWLARLGVRVADPAVEGYLVDLVTSAVWILGTALATWVMTRTKIDAFLQGTALSPSPAPRRAI